MYAFQLLASAVRVQLSSSSSGAELRTNHHDAPRLQGDCPDIRRHQRKTYQRRPAGVMALRTHGRLLLVQDLF
jgi:hypothetical protein